MGGYPSAISTSYGTGMYTYVLCIFSQDFTFLICVCVFLHHLHPFITKKPQQIKFLYRCVVFVLQFQVNTNI